MKHLIAILLSCIVLLIATKDMAVYALFKVNQQYVTSQFCVNKDKAEMKCNGKCFLKKQIKENKENKTNFPSSLPEEITNITLFTIANSVQTLFVPSQKYKVVSTPQKLSIQGYLREIFHPPTTTFFS
ncbi:MAG: hypothetical protein ACPG5B_00775 [Chitinophagales bacterium]